MTEALFLLIRVDLDPVPQYLLTLENGILETAPTVSLWTNLSGTLYKPFISSDFTQCHRSASM